MVEPGNFSPGVNAQAANSLSTGARDLPARADQWAGSYYAGRLHPSGAPWLEHVRGVADILRALGMDDETACAAMLLGAESAADRAAVHETFGKAVGALVEGVGDMGRIQSLRGQAAELARRTDRDRQLDSLRKMFLAMAQDLRVVLIKLADQVQTLRELAGNSSAPLRETCGRDTLELFAPLANWIGVWQLKWELEDLAFQCLQPDAYRRLAAELDEQRLDREAYVRDVVDRLRAELNDARIGCAISGRPKHIYSIWRKLQKKNLTLEQLSDIRAVRVLVPGVKDCYAVLGLVHNLWMPIPEEFDDYIARPKANGYSSLHTAVVGPLGKVVEVQIRTHEMHRQAELGFAAHWRYKQGSSADVAFDRQIAWLRRMLSWGDEQAAEGGTHAAFHAEMFHDSVFVLTPQGRVIDLPRGSTPVDFAYAIHSDVGDHCVAARVNNEPVALRTELRSGDVVEIVTAPGARPNPGWLNFVRTGRARSKIRHYLKTMELEESRALGEKLLAQAMRAEGLSMPSADALDSAANALWQQLIRWSGNRTRGELMTDIAIGRKIAIIVAKRLAQLMAERGTRPDAVTLTLGRYSNDDAVPAQGLVVVDGGEGASVQLATCCRPIPGDDIVGYLGRGEGLMVHTAECHFGRRLAERDPERWMPVEWADEPTRAFETAITVLVGNGKGVLAQVASAVSAAQADITHIDMGEDRAAETTELRLLVTVRDRQHLADALRTIRRCPPVLRVWRVKP